MDETDSHEILVDFGMICRLCLTGDGVLINLFSTESALENGNKSVPDKIMDLMAIAIIKNDGFPPWICHNCLSQVDKCYEFFNQCRTNQTALKESYIAALSEANVNIIPVKVEYDELEAQSVELKEKLINLCNGYSSEVIKKNSLTAEEDDESSEQFFVLQEVEEDFKSAFNGSKNDSDGYIVRRFISNGDEESFILQHEEEEEEEEEFSKGATETDSSGLYNCNATFHNKNAITSHIKFKHSKSEGEPTLNESEKLSVCKYCGLSYSHKNTNRHLEVVHRMTRNTESDQRDVGSFDCQICYRPFLRQSSLRNHISKMHGDNLEMMAEVENCEIVWSCNECDSVFLEEVYLMQHYGSKHSKYPLEVDALRRLKSKSLICSCGVIGSNSFDFSLHSIFNHSEEKPDGNSECPGCDKTFEDFEKLKNHLISYHWFSSMSYDNECVFCRHSFDSNDSLRLHLSESHKISFEKNLLEETKTGKKKKDVEEEEGEGDERRISCEKAEEKTSKCEKGLSMCDNCGELLKSGRTDHNHERNCPFSHKCTLCGKGYKTSTHLRRHVNEFHNTLAPIKCPLCPKIFPRKMNLHHHYKRRHLKQTKKYVCSYCGQSLKGIVALRSHEDRLHRNVRNYKCSECPEAFTTRGILRKHAQRHLTERPMLQCPFCEKKFSTISGIERHIKTHEGVKEFHCETPLCGKSFYTKSELKRHIKFHTRDFKHACPVCNHKFMSPGELKKHSTKHTGERPFKCHLCSCAYARRDDKVKHLKRVHNLKVKRVYGKSFIKSSQEESELVDTIVIDEGSTANDCGEENRDESLKNLSAQ